MGLGDDQLVNPTVVSGTLRCPICTDVYVAPVFSSGKPCQHTFCRDCIDRALGQRQQCPSCRAPLKRKHLQAHQAIRSLLDELQVFCDVRCGWTGRQDALPAHMQACPARQLEEARRELEDQRTQLTLHREENSKLRDQLRQLALSAAQKDATIVTLQADVAAARKCADFEVAVRLADMQAEAASEVAAKAVAAAKAAHDASRKAREVQQAARGEAGENQKSLQIFVRSFGGRHITIELEPYDTIDVAKTKIQDKTGTPPDMFYLTYAGKNLNDEKTVADYGIRGEATLTIHGRLLSRAADLVEMDGGPIKAQKRSRV